MTAFISLSQVRKTFGQAIAIDRVNLEINKGEFMTFLGPSGSGKTTTLFAIAGFDDPSEGEILIDGVNVLTVPTNKRNIGMVFQRYTLFPHLTVAENIAFPLKVRGWTKDKISARVKETLSLVRLDAYANRKPSELSGGQQQRVAIARALAYEPPVLLMDEPLSALDKKLRDELQGELKRIHQATGVTILYVTHDQEEALRLSDRIAVFNAGKIEQVGTGQELYQNPKSQFVAGFVGNSNFVEVKVEQVGNAQYTVSLPDQSLIILPFTSLNHGSLVVGQKANLMIRPDHFSLAKENSADALIIGTLLDISYLGESLQLKLVTSWGQELSLRLSSQTFASSCCQVNDKLELLIDTQSVRIFALDA